MNLSIKTCLKNAQLAKEIKYKRFTTPLQSVVLSPGIRLLVENHILRGWTHLNLSASF